MLSAQELCVVLTLVQLLTIAVFHPFFKNAQLLSLFVGFSIIFNIAGLYIFAFFPAYVSEVYFLRRLYLLKDADVAKAILVAHGGLLVVIYSYILCAGAFARSPAGWTSINLFRISPWRPTFRIDRRLTLITCVAVACAAALAASDADLRSNFHSLYLGGGIADWVEAREEARDNAIFVALAFNIVPFLALSCLAYSYTYDSRGFKLFTWIVILAAGMFLLMTTQKRGFIIFLVMVLFCRSFFKACVAKHADESGPNRSRRKGNLFTSLAMTVTVGFCVLLVLYYVFLDLTDLPFEDATELLVQIAVSRILGRLSLSILMYTYYYPGVVDHYGFSNVSMFGSLFGFDYLRTNALVLQVFSVTEEPGASAAAAITEFYSGFGWSGLVVACSLLGGFIYWADTKLGRLERTPGNMVFIIFCAVTMYYLTQASIFRAALGYGGVYFVALWLATQLRWPGARAAGGSRLRFRLTAAASPPYLTGAAGPRPPPSGENSANR